MTFISILLLLLSTLLLELCEGRNGEKKNNGEKSQAIVLHLHRIKRNKKTVLWSGISSSITWFNHKCAERKRKRMKSETCFFCFRTNYFVVKGIPPNEWLVIYTGIISPQKMHGACKGKIKNNIVFMYSFERFSLPSIASSLRLFLLLLLYHQDAL